MVVLLVVMEWTAAITGDPAGLFLDFFSKEKKLGQPFSKVEMDVQVRMFFVFFGLCGSQAKAQNTESLNRLYSIRRLL